MTTCPNFSPPDFTGRWRDWHRGHGCDLDDGKPRTEEGQSEIAALTRRGAGRVNPPERKGGQILTFTGRYVYPLDMQPDDICIEDIAAALANQCRFSGHTWIAGPAGERVSAPYSVAQHSVYVSELVERWANEERSAAVPVFALRGLLHDASEAYLVDLPKPIKVDMPTYREAEERAQAAVCIRFGLPIAEPGIVKDADAVLLNAEKRDLMGVLTSGWWATKIEPWPHGAAREAFLARFQQLADACGVLR